MTKIEKVASYFKSLLGTKTVSSLGAVDSLMIKRYALAVGETNKLYYDCAYAKENGYAGIIAPPNLLPSIMDWGVGKDEVDLNKDGLSNDFFLLNKTFNGIRAMGGGEEKEFHKPVVAGTEITMHSEVVDTYMKEGTNGKIAFLILRNEYVDQHGEVLCICRRTILAR